MNARVLAVIFYAVHAANLAWRYRAPWDALWACHVGCLLVAVGGLWAAIGTSWLVLGDALWVLDLLSGGSLIVTSILTHVGGLVLGIRVVRRSGFPHATWIRAALAMAGLLLVSRLITPRAANVNLAFFIHPGWESKFPTHLHYLLFLAVVCSLVFGVVELLARRLVPVTETPA